MTRLPAAFGVVIGVSILGLGCGRSGSPTAPSSEVSTPVPSQNTPAAAAWGPETPPFNLEAILRGDGFGLVKFRQPNDQDKIVYLDVWIRDLLPNTSYSLQRAADARVDGNCTSSSWLTLGKGPTPEPIITDDRGTGRAALWRDLAAFPVGSAFDIHFRVIQNGTSPLVVPLQSDCYEFVISQ